jgi:hypothetical protein
MASEEEVRAALEPLVGQMVSVNRAGPIMLMTVQQAEENEPYDAWAAGDWIMGVGEPDQADNPSSWSYSTLAYLAEHGVTVTAVQT